MLLPTLREHRAALGFLFFLVFSVLSYISPLTIPVAVAGEGAGRSQNSLRGKPSCTFRGDAR